VADGWCWFVPREKYGWLVAGGWFVLREKYCWLVADKPSEQGVCVYGLSKKFTVRFYNMNFEPHKRMRRKKRAMVRILNIAGSGALRTKFRRNFLVLQKSRRQRPSVDNNVGNANAG
jgi:hypothetical protein